METMINFEEKIVRETGRTFDEIRAMSNVELYYFIEGIRNAAYADGWDDAY